MFQEIKTIKAINQINVQLLNFEQSIYALDALKLDVKFQMNQITPSYNRLLASKNKLNQVLMFHGKQPIV